VLGLSQFATPAPPSRFTGYQMLSKAGQKTGHLDGKTRELIALAVAVTSHCDGCITVHTSEALKHGATREESCPCRDDSGDMPSPARRKPRRLRCR